MVSARKTSINPQSCERCNYLIECCMFWRFCPYDGTPVHAKKERAKLCKSKKYKRLIELIEAMQ